MKSVSSSNRFLIPRCAAHMSPMIFADVSMCSSGVFLHQLKHSNTTISIVDVTASPNADSRSFTRERDSTHARKQR